MNLSANSKSMMNYEEILELLSEKVHGQSDVTWEELSIELGISPTSLRKMCGGAYGGVAVYNYLKDISLSSKAYASDEQIERFEKAKEEAQKERYKLYDQRREWNKVIREEARFEHLKEVMLDAIDGLDPIQFVENNEQKNHGVEAALLVSDLHLGLIIDTPLNYYDISVAKDRLVQLANKTIKYCKIHNVTKLNVCLCGDLISGVIQQSARCDQEEDTVSQLMTVCELITQMMSFFKNKLPEVVLYSTFGNHARVISNKKESTNRENFERLVPFYLKARIPQLKIVDSHGVDYLEANIGGLKTIITHGDKDSWNNADVNFARLLGYVPQQIFLGHVHDFHNVDLNGCDVVVNGCIDGSDEYAMSLRKNAPPHQVLRIYDDDICTYKIMLD